MIFVFGGAYQGMEDYAREQCGAAEIVHLTENDALMSTISALTTVQICVSGNTGAVKVRSL